MRTVHLLKLGLFSLLASACSRVDAPAPPNAAQAHPQVVAAQQPTAPAPAPASAPASAPGTAPGTASATAFPPAMATAPVTTSATSSGHRATALKVDRLVVARGVEGREPQGADTIFASDEKRVFAFVEVENPEHAPGDLRVQFVAPDGEAQPPVELAVGESPRWRTWAFTRRAHAPGTWKAVVRDERGRVLASTEFEVRS